MVRVARISFRSRNRKLCYISVIGSIGRDNRGTSRYRGVLSRFRWICDTGTQRIDSLAERQSAVKPPERLLI